MKCKTVHRKLIFYLEGDLPESMMKQVAAHISDCPDCEAFALDMQKTLGIINIEKEVERNPFFYTRVKAKLETEGKYGKVHFWNPVLVKVVQPVFFSMLLIAGIYAGFRIGTPIKTNLVTTEFADSQVVPYLNEMQTEPIENFLME